MTVSTTAVDRSLDGGNRQARDMRGRLALEEVDRRYDVRNVSFEELSDAAPRAASVRADSDR
jgi:hypothetical protein